MKKLNFGCGEFKLKGFDNADIQPEADLSFDFEKFPYPIKDNVYNFIRAKNILDHLQDPKKILKELWRISKNDAEIEIICPHYTSRSSYDDLEHRHHFSHIAFIYFLESKDLLTKKNMFELIELKLIPSKIGKFIPGRLRERLSLLLNGLISYMHVRLRVIK